MCNSCSTTRNDSIAAGGRSQAAFADRLAHPVEDVAGEPLGCRVRSRKRRLRVQVAVIDPLEDGPQRVTGGADVDDDAVGIQLFAAELDIDHVGGAVQPPSGSEDIALQAVRDHRRGRGRTR